MAIITVGARGNRQPCTTNYRCDGTNDQTEINAAISAAGVGGTVYLSSGRFVVNGDITLTNGVNLIGKGTSTILDAGTNRTGPYARHLYINGATSGLQTVRGFELHGNICMWSRGNNIRHSYIVSRELSDVHDSAILLACPSGTNLSNIRYDNCACIDVDAMGFVMSSPKDLSDPNHLISNVVYANCDAIRCGHASTRFIPSGSPSCWCVGFDIEWVNVTNALYINCYAERSWESGFHGEASNEYINVKYVRCRSIRNGIQKAIDDATYVSWCAGFTMMGGMSAHDCIADTNYTGFRMDVPSVGAMSGKCGALYRCTIRDSQFAQIQAANNTGTYLIADKCTSIVTTGTPSLLRTGTHTGMRVTNYQRIPSGSGATTVSGTDNVISYDDDGGT